MGASDFMLGPQSKIGTVLAAGELPSQRAYRLERLTPANAPAYRPLTFPAFRPLLDGLADQPQVVALGASRFGRPIGLALAVMHPAAGVGELQSLYVLPGYREIGLGTDLVASLESLLQAEGCQYITTTWMTGTPGVEVFESVLLRRGWEPPQCRLLVFRGTAASMEGAAWLDRYRLPAEYTIFPWRDLTAADRQSILDRQAEQPWYHETLSPFFEEESIEYMNSLGLRYQGYVIGWMITHRIAPDTVRFTRLLIHPDPRFRGRAPCLLAESIKLCMAYANLHGMRETLKAVFVADPTNLQMARFAKRRLAPFMATTESRGSWKRLADVPASPREPS